MLGFAQIRSTRREVVRLVEQPPGSLGPGLLPDENRCSIPPGRRVEAHVGACGGLMAPPSGPRILYSGGSVSPTSKMRGADADDDLPSRLDRCILRVSTASLFSIDSIVSSGTDMSRFDTRRCA